MNHCHHHPVYYDRTRRLGWGADWGQDDKDYLPGAKLSRIIDPQNYCCLRLQLILNLQNYMTQTQFCLLYGGPQINIFKSSSTFLCLFNMSDEVEMLKCLCLGRRLWQKGNQDLSETVESSSSRESFHEISIQGFSAIQLGSQIWNLTRSNLIRWGEESNQQIQSLAWTCLHPPPPRWEWNEQFLEIQLHHVIVAKLFGTF